MPRESTPGPGFLRHVPPVAVPVQTGDIRCGLAALRRPACSADRFRSALAAATGSPYVGLVSSGREALSAILLALRHLSERTRVAVPAYTCPTVVQAVLYAGLEPILCDVSPRTLEMDPEAFESLPKEDLLAVVPTHLYGLVQDVTRLLSLGRTQGFFVIEDAAQALGATAQGRVAGTLGDAGFYSLGRGKCLPVGHGGVIVAGERCGPSIAELLKTPEVSEGHPPGARALGLFLGYGLATHPRGWWLIGRTFLNPAGEGTDVRKLPRIRLGGLSAVQAAIGGSILARLTGLQETWRSNARRLMAMLSAVDGVQVPEIAPGTVPVFLRLPFVVDSCERANALYERLWRQGIGVSRSYTRSLPDLYSERLSLDPAGFPGAARLAACLLTLPTHTYLREDDFARVCQALEQAV